jgi:flagellar protein FliO/FliZ
VDPLALEEALAERRPPARLHAAPDGAPAAGSTAGSTIVAPRPAPAGLAGSVFDRAGWAGFMNALRERTVRR